MKRNLILVAAVSALGILSCSKPVIEEEPAVPVLESIELYNVSGTVEIEIGDSFRTDYELLPEGVEDFVELEWTSSDESIATVRKGRVKGVASGRATITASCGEISASFKVKVIPVRVKSFEFEKQEISIPTGGERQVVLSKLDPENGSLETIDWKIIGKDNKDSDIAEVNGFDGKAVKVNGLKVGTAYLCGYLGETEGGRCKLNIVDGAQVQDFTIPETLEFELKSKSKTIKIEKFAPETADLSTIVWTNSNESVATVSFKGQELTITALKAGTTIITGTCANKVSKTCTVKINDQNAAQDFSIPAALTADMLDGTIEVPVTGLVPKTADCSSIAWRVKDENVLSIQSIAKDKLVLEIKNSGSTELTGTCLNNKSHKCQIRITNGPLEYFRFPYTELKVLTDISHKCNLEQSPSKYYKDEIKWEIANPEIAEITSISTDCNQITAVGKKVGTTTVRAWVDNQYGYEASFVMKVEKRDYVFDASAPEFIRAGSKFKVKYVKDPNNDRTPFNLTYEILSGSATFVREYGMNEFEFQSGSEGGKIRIRLYADDGVPEHSKTLVIQSFTGEETMDLYHYCQSTDTWEKADEDPVRLYLLTEKDNTFKLQFRDSGIPVPDCLLKDIEISVTGYGVKPASGEPQLLTIKKGDYDRGLFWITARGSYDRDLNLEIGYPANLQIQNSISKHISLRPYLTLFEENRTSGQVRKVAGPGVYSMDSGMVNLRLKKGSCNYYLVQSRTATEGTTFNKDKSVIIPYESYIGTAINVTRGGYGSFILQKTGNINTILFWMNPEYKSNAAFYYPFKFSGKVE